MHARMPKNFILDQRIERAADAIETSAASYRGRWAEACWPLPFAECERDGRCAPDRADEACHGPLDEHGHLLSGSDRCEPGHPSRFARVHLDLGCGKGAYIAAMARRHPDTLFIGMDSEPVCVVHAAQLVLDQKLPNALVIPGDAARLNHIFAPGELDAISINFPTPHPKRRNAALRVTSAAHLEGYRPLLANGATIAFRTDSLPLYEYSLPQFNALGWKILCATHDDRAAHPDQPVTEYEQRLTEQGATVHAVYAQAPTEPASPEQLRAALDLPQSLIDYLPEDLFDGDYVPYGMSYAVDNLRNRKRHLEARGDAHA